MTKTSLPCSVSVVGTVSVIVLILESGTVCTMVSSSEVGRTLELRVSSNSVVNWELGKSISEIY